MSNNWNIPDWLEMEVRDRDKAFVYGGNDFVPANESVRAAVSWEHIIDRTEIISREMLRYVVVAVMQVKDKKRLLLGWLPTIV